VDVGDRDTAPGPQGEVEGKSRPALVAAVSVKVKRSPVTWFS
jgi:hypothetical protein